MYIPNAMFATNTIINPGQMYNVGSKRISAFAMKISTR